MLKQDLVQKVEEFGGMWKTNEEIDEKIANISIEKDRKIAIKTQIQFRKIVLGAKHKDKKYFRCHLRAKHLAAKCWSVILKK